MFLGNAVLPMRYSGVYFYTVSCYKNCTGLSVVISKDIVMSKKRSAVVSDFGTGYAWYYSIGCDTFSNVKNYGSILAYGESIADKYKIISPFVTMAAVKNWVGAPHVEPPAASFELFSGAVISFKNCAELPGYKSHILLFAENGCRVLQRVSKTDYSHVTRSQYSSNACLKLERCLLGEPDMSHFLRFTHLLYVDLGLLSNYAEEGLEVSLASDSLTIANFK